GMLYFLGITFAPDETEDREHTELDETQPVAMMPSFNDPDEAIAWHDEQKRRYEQLKNENHDLSKLVELLESTVIQIEHLKTDMDELRRERNERNENKINTGIDSLAVDGGNAGISTGSDPGA